MIPIKEKHTKKVIAAGIVLLLMLAALSQVYHLSLLEYLFLDLRFILRGPRHFPEQIAIVGIDEPSLDALGRWPWPREKHGALLQLLKQKSFRPRTIAYDILFEHPDRAATSSDSTFAETTSEFREDLILAYFFEKGFVSSVEIDSGKERNLERFAIAETDVNQLENMDKTSLPYESLLLNTSLGFANNSIGVDGRTHSMQLVLKHHGRIYPSLALLTAAKFIGAELKDISIEKNQIKISTLEGTRVIPINDSGEMLINYFGSFRDIPHASFLALLQEGRSWMDQNKKAVQLKKLRDKCVIIGATALGLEDRRVTPFYKNDPATSIQAQAIANILEGNFLKKAPRAVSLFIFFFLGIIVIVFTATQRALQAFGSVFSILTVYLGLSYLAFLNNYWIEVVWPIFVILISFIFTVCLRYFLTAEELKKTYLQLIHVEKMASLGTLSASIAHEYRNFMASISVAADSCTIPNIDREHLNKCLEIITRTVKKAGQVSEGLLTFARKNESVKTDGRLDKTIEEVLLIIGKNLSLDSVLVKKEFEETGLVRYDEGQIAQVLMNMLRNAHQALKEKPGEKQITLRLKNMPNQVMIEIEDNGPGIPKKILNRLFEPFATSKKAGEGTGLGLSVCHGIILNHGGDIKVKTEEGKGTLWQITLPKT